MPKTFYLQQGVPPMLNRKEHMGSLSSEPRVFIDDRIHGATADSKTADAEIIDQCEAEDWLEALGYLGRFR
jgi:hypothetical protein